MLIFLGLVCVAWTTFELVRLGLVTRERMVFEASMAQAAPSARFDLAGKGRSRRLRRADDLMTWDDRGGPVRVEGLAQV